MKHLGENLVVMSLLSILAITILVIVFTTPIKKKPTGDFALTDRQVLDKAQLCHKEGMAIQLVYDDEWNVYAVKCVYGGFTGDGRRK